MMGGKSISDGQDNLSSSSLNPARNSNLCKIFALNRERQFIGDILADDNSDKSSDSSENTNIKKDLAL